MSRALLSFLKDRSKFILLLTSVFFLLLILNIKGVALRDKNENTTELTSAPAAPLAQNIKTEKLNTLASEDIEVVSNPNEEKIATHSNIQKIDFSPNGEYILTLDGMDHHDFAKHNENSNEEFTLKIRDKNGKDIDTVSTNKVIDAKFTGENVITYQTVENNGGVFKYDLKSKKHEKIIETNDPHAIQNIEMIDDKRFFFIQPKSGKIGFGEIGKTEFEIIDEKKLDLQSNYSEAGAYRFASLSPDKKYVAFYDLTPQADFTVKVIILPTNGRALENKYFEADVFLLARDMHADDKLLEWSNDSRYLIVADDGSVVDVKSRNFAYQPSEKKLSKVKISPDSKKFALLNMEDNSGFVQNFGNNTKVDLVKDISQINWLNNDLLVVTIADGIYQFDTNAAKLESVSEEKGEYEILESDKSHSQVWVKKDDEIVKITKN